MTSVPTKPIDGQKTGTSGLRKKTKEFKSDNYLANWCATGGNERGAGLRAAAVAPAVALGAAIVRPCLRFLHPRVTAPPRMLLCCCRRIQALFNALGEEAVGKTIGLGGDGRYFNKEAVQVRCA